jgi:hypothetical protein
MSTPKTGQKSSRRRSDEEREERIRRREKRREEEGLQGEVVVWERNMESASLGSVDEQEEYVEEAQVLLGLLQLLSYNEEGKYVRDKFVQTCK